MLTEPLPVTAAVINYQTPELTERAVTSLRRFYPKLMIVLIDNGSNDRESLPALERLRSLSPEYTLLIANSENIHHGPAMDQALRRMKTPFGLLIDSDCEIRKGGCIEAMYAIASADDRIYAVGKKVFMNRRGFDVPETAAGALGYVRPIFMFLRREYYDLLPSFEKHGAPCLANMKSATSKGLLLGHFPVEEYVYHEGRGTASRVGYNLGWRGKVNHLLDRLGL